MSEQVFSPHSQLFSHTDPVVLLAGKLGIEEAAKRLGYKPKDLSDYLILVAGDKNFEYFAKHCLYVEDDTRTDNKIVPFELNAAQKKLDEAIEKQKKEGRPVRLIHLKPRQYGASTYFAGRIYQEIVRRKNRHATTISYGLESADHLRGIAGRFDDKMRYPHPQITGKASKTWRVKDNDSTWRIDSAEQLHAGHSFTNQILHISELSRWDRDVSVLMRGLTSSVQAIPDTMIIIESTANGYGDYFHEMWERAKNGSGYIPVFVAWFEIEKYKTPFYAGRTFDNKHTVKQFEDSLDSYEKALIDNHGISLEQLHWRRRKIEEDLKGDDDSFFEQYPSTDEEAFLASGRQYFPKTLVSVNLVAAKKSEFKTGDLSWSGESIEFSEDRYGNWRIFEEPKVGWYNRYVTGSDPAEGVSVTDDNKDPDYSVCTVFDRVEKKEVARFRARVETDVFEDEIAKAARWYGSACDCVETNNTAGGAVIKGLKARDVNLYIRQIEGQKEDKETEQYGFRTDKNTREILLNEFRLKLKTGKYKSGDTQLWGECQTFVVGKDGKPMHQYGAHDDVVFSAALASEADNQAGMTSVVERPSEIIPKTPDSDYWQKEDNTVNAEF